MAMTKTKEEVDEWIKRMDVSLVFVSSMMRNMGSLTDLDADCSILNSTDRLRRSGYPKPFSVVQQHSWKSHRLCATAAKSVCRECLFVILLGLDPSGEFYGPS
ncbi:hypothetical protein SISSUDRAFT_1048318 [Sistotremastrum suecicum HHB10207 ss-3]|uniref:Uncharacterized protein n=1 Tax=Sistotremastrum suecicum HHB10207 ss-3 TaxID=1314776 RepID=A0A166CKZ1_9AGAM|nr:hypothetical protein SISSUDRAFT_1048318 [Sistotremastrum suecicum HHB10207 ss-3]